MKLTPVSSTSAIQVDDPAVVLTTPMILAFKGDNGVGDIFAPAPPGVDYVSLIDADFLT